MERKLSGIGGKIIRKHLLSLVGGRGGGVVKGVGLDR